MIAVSYHETVNVLQGMIASGEVPAASPFARPEWFTLLESGGRAGMVATAHDDENRVILAMVQRRGSIESLVNWYSFTWQPIFQGEAAHDRLLRELAHKLRRRAHRITLWPLPDEAGVATQLEAAFRAAGWQVAREQCDHNHVLHVGDRSFAEYWAGRPGKMRTTLKRKAAKVEVEIHTRFDDAAWTAYEAIYALSWKPAEGRPDLLREFAQQEGSAGRIRLGLAHHEGEPVAAQFWTVEMSPDGPIAYIHKLAHLEAFKSLSAGTTLSAALFEHVIDRDKVTLVDFGTGNDPYKRDWMEENRPRFRLDCIDPMQPRAWALLGKRAAQRVARALQRS